MLCKHYNGATLQGGRHRQNSVELILCLVLLQVYSKYFMVLVAVQRQSTQVINIRALGHLKGPRYCIHICERLMNMQAFRDSDSNALLLCFVTFVLM